MRIFLLLISTGIGTNLFSQNIGIGTTVPTGKVQVNHRSTVSSPSLYLIDSTSQRGGNIRFRNLNSTPFVEISAASESPLHSAHQYLDISSDSTFIATFRGNGNVGIGNIAPIYKLDVNGAIRSASMIGSGNKPVFADANGQLYTSAGSNTSYLSISPKAFTKYATISSFVLYATDYRTYLAPAGSSDVIGASVNLPHGVRITGMKAVFVDNSASDIIISLLFANSVSPGSVDICEVTTTGANANMRTLTAAANHLVDNNNNFYSVLITPKFPGTWDSVNLYLTGIVITYSY